MAALQTLSLNDLSVLTINSFFYFDFENLSLRHEKANYSVFH